MKYPKPTTFKPTPEETKQAAQRLAAEATRDMVTDHKHGGARAGAGRKQRPETVVLSFRVPYLICESLRVQIAQLIREAEM